MESISDIKKVYNKVDKLDGQKLLNYLEAASSVNWSENIVGWNTGAKIQRTAYTINGVYVFVDRSKDYDKGTHIIVRCPIYDIVSTKWITEC